MGAAPAGQNAGLWRSSSTVPLGRSARPPCSESVSCLPQQQSHPLRQSRLAEADADARRCAPPAVQGAMGLHLLHQALRELLLWLRSASVNSQSPVRASRDRVRMCPGDLSSWSPRPCRGNRFILLRKTRSRNNASPAVSGWHKAPPSPAVRFQAGQAAASHPVVVY